MQDLIDRAIASIPLELFTFLGSFIEEILAPIPSPLILTSAGIVAAQREYTWIAIVFLAIIGAVGKTLASWIVYELAEKGEDIVFGKFGKYLGVSHQQVENLGALFSKGWWDELVIFILRALPITPTFLVSVMAGVIKLNVRSFLVATFLGTIVRNIMYLYVGMYGVTSATAIFDSLENGFTAVLVLGVGAAVAYYLLSKIRQYIMEKATPDEKN